MQVPKYLREWIVRLLNGTVDFFSAWICPRTFVYINNVCLIGF